MQLYDTGIITSGYFISTVWSLLSAVAILFICYIATYISKNNLIGLSLKKQIKKSLFFFIVTIGVIFMYDIFINANSLYLIKMRQGYVDLNLWYSYKKITMYLLSGMAIILISYFPVIYIYHRFIINKKIESEQKIKERTIIIPLLLASLMSIWCQAFAWPHINWEKDNPILEPSKISEVAVFNKNEKMSKNLYNIHQKTILNYNDDYYLISGKLPVNFIAVKKMKVNSRNYLCFQDLSMKCFYYEYTNKLK